MTDNMKKLMEKVSADEALKAKLDELGKQAAGGGGKAKKLLKAIAAEQGIALADEDFEADEGALPDEALEGVAGGYIVRNKIDGWYTVFDDKTYEPLSSERSRSKAEKIDRQYNKQ